MVGWAGKRTHFNRERRPPPPLVFIRGQAVQNPIVKIARLDREIIALLTPVVGAVVEKRYRLFQSCRTMGGKPSLPP